MKRPNIEAIKERCKSASEGRWIRSGPWIKYDEPVKRDTSAVILDEKNVCLGDIYDWMNADFIAHARTDIPALLAYIEELESANRWIPVEKSLPDKEMYLLTLDKQLNIKMVFTKNFSPEDDIICWKPLNGV